MALFGNQFLNQLATGDQIRDYQHGARTFVDGVYRLGPKSQALYHVYIDVNPNINYNDPSEIGLMAKSVSLPRYSVQNRVLNAYNRKNVVQEKINYEPINITFHDDSADVVLKFWKGYYEHYFRDADHQENLFGMAHKYKDRATQKWGYGPINGSSVDGTLAYINSIRIYSFHQKTFTSYVLVKPTIINFQHGQHIAGEYGLMEHTMTVAYEAVKYETGPVSAGTVQGFNRGHYDNTPSPLSALGGGTRSILGPGGLVQGVGDIIGAVQSGNILGAVLTGARVANNAKNMSLKDAARAELTQTAVNILRGNNPTSPVFVPTAGTIKDGLSKSVQSIPGLGAGRSTGLNTMNSQSNAGPDPRITNIFR